MLIPLRDVNPTRITPVVTVGLMGLNILVSLFQLSLDARTAQAFIFQFGAIPAEVVHFTSEFSGSPLPGPLRLVSAMFLHGGLMHLGGNMLYLWIFGNNIEEVLGPVRFLVFYLVTGVAASLVHIVTDANSPVPMVGASGAISGILGAYILLFPRSNVVSLVFIFFFIRTVVVPAAVFIGIWFLMQVLSAGSGGGIAWFAHIGGFLAGIAFVRLFQPRSAGWYTIYDD